MFIPFKRTLKTVYTTGIDNVWSPRRVYNAQSDLNKTSCILGDGKKGFSDRLTLDEMVYRLPTDIKHNVSSSSQVGPTADKASNPFTPN